MFEFEDVPIIEGEPETWQEFCDRRTALLEAAEAAEAQHPDVRLQWCEFAAWLRARAEGKP